MIFYFNRELKVSISIDTIKANRDMKYVSVNIKDIPFAENWEVIENEGWEDKLYKDALDYYCDALFIDIPYEESLKSKIEKLIAFKQCKELFFKNGREKTVF